MYWDSALWFTLLVGFLAMEANTVSLVSIWFAVGALGALIASLLSVGIGWQVGIFFALSLLLLMSLGPILRKYLKPKRIRTNVDAVMGSCGYVTEPVDNLIPTGRVKLGGMSWAARSESGAQIPQGTKVQVVRVEGVKVVVEPVK